MKKIFYSKNLLFLVFINLFLIQDCSLLLLIPKNCNEKLYNIEIGKPFKGIPSNIVIDENNNGIISFKQEIIKINNLEIGEKLCLKDPQEKYIVENTAYSTDKDGDGILIYSRQSEGGLPILSSIEGTKYYIESFNNYIVKIEKNNFLVDKVKKLYEIDAYYYYKGFKILQFDKNNFLVYFLSQGYGEKKLNVVLEKINNLNLKEYNIKEYKFELNDSYDSSNFYELYKYLDLEVKIDLNGDGWYAFKISSNNIIFEKIENFKNISYIKELSIGNRSLYNFLTTKGDGYILNYNGSMINYSDLKLSNSNINNFITDNLNNSLLKLGNDLFIPYNFSIDSKSINLNKNGDGIIFFNKNISNTNNQKIALVIKKIKDFKEIGESIVSSEGRDYDYYASSINSNGNGIVIIQDSANIGFYDRNFILKRIRNYELEK